MANIGSGLDIGAIVDGLMSIEQRGLKRLEQKQALYENQQSAYTKLRGLLKQFSSSITNLDSILKQNIFKTSSSNESVASIAVSGNTKSSGNFSLQVKQLAQAHQIASTAFANADQPLELGNELILTQGTNTMSVSINSSDSLEHIRDNINNSFNNPGINASILKTTNADTGNDEYRLVLTSTNTGTANEIMISGDGLDALELNNTLQAAQDAQCTINNFEVVRSSNTLNDVLDGAIIQLNSKGNSDLSITPDLSNQTQNIHDALTTLVDSYNSVVDLLAKNQSLKGLRDSTNNLVSLNLKNAMEQSIGSDTINSLYKLGISLSESEKKTNDEGVEYVVTGKLSIDEEVLTAAINNSAIGLRSFFSDTGSNFDSKLQSAISDVETRTIYNRERIISQEHNFVQQNIDREEDRLTTVRKNLTYQYAELDALIVKYQQIGNFLDQQIAMFSAGRNK